MEPEEEVEGAFGCLHVQEMVEEPRQHMAVSAVVGPQPGIAPAWIEVHFVEDQENQLVEADGAFVEISRTK